jgi:hypothetical protein
MMGSVVQILLQSRRLVGVEKDARGATGFTVERGMVATGGVAAWELVAEA